MSAKGLRAPERGVITIRGSDIPTVTRDVEQGRLRFYPDNPRIYSLVRGSGRVPDQDEILEQLLAHEHVRILKEDIASNGGLIDPLIVREGDLVVLEGNSRLAACRFLATRDPIRWATVRCTVLPADIDEKLVFALLGQYHLKGKQDWAPYEKAGFLYRRHAEHGVELSMVAEELGISAKEARHLVTVYQFMLEKDESDRSRWSFYDEYLRSNRIKPARDEHAKLDDFVVSEIKSGRIPKAMELRERLPVICAAPPKVLRRYMDGATPFEEAYEAAVNAGGESHALKKLRRFRDWLALGDTEDDLLEASKQVRDKMVFELKEIEKRSKKLKELLEGHRLRGD